ncbi:MAG TPA: hypothetical protein VNA21_13625 [Steroidobacteraceae bacterium]|nr:hypothetical protein [Steroidobacteraceae bacterium]
MTHKATATNVCSLTHNRREFIASIGLATGAMALGLPTIALASGARAQDWTWLLGNWDVWHRRLKERLAGNDDWEEFSGKSAFWQTMNGLGNIDDNSIDIPSGSYRGLSIRAFDEKSGKWSIWWLDGRNPTYIEPPVLGRFEAGAGTFIGRDSLKGRAIIMRFRWNDVYSARPWWEQAFSPDEGKTWEVNWRNYFTRTATTASALPMLEGAPHDWDFLVGQWNVKHRRLRSRLTGSTQWDEFAGTLNNWAVLGGHANVGDNYMNFPGGEFRGIGLRAFDPTKREWLSWWLDGRNPSAVGAPLRGNFRDGIGTFIGDDTLDGRAIKTRVIWSRITPRSARWEQAASADSGRTWETNWTSDFERQS